MGPVHPTGTRDPSGAPGLARGLLSAPPRPRTDSRTSGGLRTSVMREKHVLVADDERHTRVTLSLVFRRAGFRVTAAEDGQQALDRVAEALRRSQSFDLLVLDIQMPGLTGIELVEALGRLGATFPILLITGYRDQDRAEDLGRKFCVEYAEKPFEPDELMGHVERVLARFEREQRERAGAAS